MENDFVTVEKCGVAVEVESVALGFDLKTHESEGVAVEIEAATVENGRPRWGKMAL